MGDWLEIAQCLFIGLVCSFLVSKLISSVTSFSEENPSPAQELPPAESSEEPSKKSSSPVITDEPEKRSAEKSTASGGLSGDDDDDDDWEGVESTELDEKFSAATAFVAATAADRRSQKVPNELRLQLYGLYKIATEGPCSTPQPSAIKISARAKWNAWQKLGVMSPEEAMQKYIMIVNDLYPSWASGSMMKEMDREAGEHSSATKGAMGPVFSTFVNEEGSDSELKMDSIHVFAREGLMDKLLECIEDGVSVNSKDSEGRTPLHWAVDCGHLDVVELLISRKTDINVQHVAILNSPRLKIRLSRAREDNDGQTPLHYAAVCEREAIARLLLDHNADGSLKDNDGQSPCELCDRAWDWMRSDN